MGIYDRDYMREEEPRRSIKTWIVILVTVTALVAAVTAFTHQARRLKQEISPGVSGQSKNDQLLAISPIDINKATFHELILLPHVSSDMANEIIEMRPFGSIEQLDDIYGIGPKRLARILPHVTIGKN